MIDKDGYRPNVGMIVCNARNQVLWARRNHQDDWQFPQGGIDDNETPEQALYRELGEEIGLTASQVEILGVTEKWLRYRLPKQYVRQGNNPVCIGQKQHWFLLRLTGVDGDVRLDQQNPAEFDRWRWVDYWQPAQEIVYFKRDVYQLALHELAPILFPEYKARVVKNRAQ